MLKPELLYTDDDADANDKDNNNNDATAWLHMLAWPLDQVNQRSAVLQASKLV